MATEHRTSSPQHPDPDLPERQEQHLSEKDGAPTVAPTPTEVKHGQGAAAEPKAETGNPADPEPPDADVRAP
ncbi:hypothetical protein [Kitasatospora sp. NPDC059673]|uniref:hypothetical protein n=1 Tax=Kitasatospora sp. NPDC059673 TaxID=3346901 RepID=UPI0036B2E441